MPKIPNNLPKVDLTLLKKLIDNLENSLQSTEEMKSNGGDLSDFNVELSKAVGLTSGIMQEATMLIADIQAVVKISQSPQPPAKNPDLLEKILGGIKGSGGSYN